MEIIAEEIDLAGSLFQVCLAFCAGILGGVVGFRYQRQHDQKVASEEARRHYRARVTGWLDEIVTFWKAENASGLSFVPVQRKFEISARRISKDISNPPVPLRPGIKTELQDLIASLNRVRDLDPAENDVDRLREAAGPVIEKAEWIRGLNTEWF